MNGWINRNGESRERSSNSEQLPHEEYRVMGWVTFYFLGDSAPKMVSLDSCTFAELTSGQGN